MSIKVCVGIMVKNEEEQIVCTLNSIKDVKNLFIYDTGSTDKTISIIREFCKENNVELHLSEGEFIDFSISRNTLLSNIYKSDCSHIILMDANDELIGYANLLEILARNPNYEVYDTTQLWKDIDKEVKFKTYRIIKNVGKYFYKGVVHEVLNISSNATHASIGDEVIIYQDRTKDKKSRIRYVKDIELLTKEYKKNPYDLRTIYYLGNSYYFLDDYVNAKKYFKKRYRISMQVNEKPNEEAYQSMVRVGKCLIFADQLSKLPTKANNFYWERAEKWFWRAWRYFNDIEPLVILASRYLDMKDYNTTFHLANLACNVNTDPKLWKDERKYNFDRYYALAISGIHVGKYEEGYDALQKIGNYAQTSQILQLTKQYEQQLTKKYVRYSSKMTVVIFGGVAYSKWHSDNLEKLGGSEYSAVRLAEELVKKGAKVIIACDCEEKFNWNNVEYVKISDYHVFLKTYIIDQLIVLRFSDYLYYGLNVGNVYLWLQDVTHIGNSIELNKKLKNIIVLSNWHKKRFIELTSQKDSALANHLESLVSIVGNAIDIERFQTEKGKEKVEKIPMRFIYSSCPTRNLQEVVKIFSKIREKYPEAELHIFSNFESSYAERYFSDRGMNDFKENVSNTPGVFVNDRVNQQELANEILKAQYWLYLPTNFDETYCITSLEMQAGHVIPITTSNGALEENVADRGFLLDHFTLLEKNGRSVKVKPSKVLKCIETIGTDLFSKMDEWTQKQCWSERIFEWLRIFA